MTRESSAGARAPEKITPQVLQRKKDEGWPIAAITAYDYATARIVDQAGIDVVLVGDSLAMVVLGYENTLPVTMDEMLHHTRAVRRGVERALLVADMPFGSYQTSVKEGVANAIRLVKEAGAEAVKVEGGKSRAALIKRLTGAEIPVVAHVGLTPQSVRKMGGYRVQAKSLAAFHQLFDDALILEAAGASALVLEGVPREAAARVTHALSIPVIGIGAGPECDGQILVLHDLVRLTPARPAKFVRQYADVSTVISRAVQDYVKDVSQRSFPGEEESYHLPPEIRAELDAEMPGGQKDPREERQKSARGTGLPQ